MALPEVTEKQIEAERGDKLMSLYRWKLVSYEMEKDDRTGRVFRTQEKTVKGGLKKADGEAEKASFEKSNMEKIERTDITVALVRDFEAETELKELMAGKKDDPSVKALRQEIAELKAQVQNTKAKPSKAPEVSK